ncbi:hypothetical protein HUT18_18380 [Streptomyces sp. NA04227]|uniref:hypothetical protein n=1 Tax=Streptomyces sp. NA04227 TaxID=2742136 RepID=UPI001590B4C3|nr:hypothetical protein [Streptomyces sp. NA04227]QKW08055.1 hypothetical protein HUT18_18380 [Streptomyces sp. NA04227]
MLMRTGLSKSEAIREGIRIAAQLYRTAHVHGVCSPDEAPALLAYQLGAPGASLPEQHAQPGQLTPRGVGRRIPPPPPHKRTAA